jgi:hypothetical protein
MPLCAHGTCSASCGEGLVECEALCVSTATDAKNCGQCGNDCGPGGTCVEGQCVCGSGAIDCGTYCTDISADPRNCGGCGIECESGRCESGHCSCEAGLTFCAREGCVDLTWDAHSCGVCDRKCADGELCRQGGCECRPGLVRDGALCRNPASDPAACGAAAAACAGATPFCEGGACVAGCSSGRVPCAMACVDVVTDPLNCGRCGETCEARELCVRGECRRFEVPPACTMCPCAVCDSEPCCRYPGLDLAVCVEANACP